MTVKGLRHTLGTVTALRNWEWGKCEVLVGNIFIQLDSQTKFWNEHHTTSLCYKLEDHGLNFRWGHWDFSL